MIQFTVGNFVSKSVNLIQNSNKLTRPIKIVGKKIICEKKDFSTIKELLKRNEIKAIVS